MKTNANMLRPMGEFNVIQRTKDGMFNATNLAKQWNQKTGQRKDVSDFLRLSATKEFAETIQQNEIDYKREIPYVKSRASRGVNAGTWMHPFLFIDFAMWLNPTFKYQVITFVYDELIKHRHLAGDNYRLLCRAITKIAPNCDFSEPAKWFNYVVFNEHKGGLRNNSSPDMLNELQRLERKYADLITEGYITSLENLKEKLRGEWAKRYNLVPLCLTNQTFNN